MKFWIKTHFLIKALFPKYIWAIATEEKKVWLTFDDGPIPEITDWVLEQLETYNAKATFFCIGENVQKHPEVFKRLIQKGHALGNHTFNHLNGWETETAKYISNVEKCAQEVSRQSATSKLFRPPYGKIKLSQSKQLRKSGYKIIMWDVVSGDFEPKIAPEKCLENVIKNIEPGSIIVFHDSIKAFPNLKYALPKTLAFLSENGYSCEALS